MKRVTMDQPVTVFGKQQGSKTLGQVVAEALAGWPNQESPQKVMSICTRLHEQGYVDLDGPDLAFLAKSIKAHPQLVAAAAAAALDAVDAASPLPTEAKA